MLNYNYYGDDAKGLGLVTNQFWNASMLHDQINTNKRKISSYNQEIRTRYARN